MSVRGEKVECAIKNKVVASYDKSALVTAGKLESTDGVTAYISHTTRKASSPASRSRSLVLTASKIAGERLSLNECCWCDSPSQSRNCINVCPDPHKH